METNEQIKSVLRESLEDELEQFLEQVSELAEGDLERLEEQAVKTSQAMGRGLLEGVLNSRLREQRPEARREGSCGHRQRLVGERAKELVTLLGKVTFVGPYYQCLPAADPETGRDCTHGEAPADVLWGVQERRTTGGVQKLISYLSARLTFEEAAQTLCRAVPLGMSGRQALTLMRPVGAALASAEDRQVNTLQAQAKQARSQPQQQPTTEIERLYIELDGVLARMRRGSVLREKEERQRTGDVYREIKAGAVFRAERGSKRSELAPGVYVDTPAQDSVRYVARRTAKGGFDWLLYQLARQCGLEQAQQVVVVGDGAPWIWNLAAEHFPGAVQIVDLYHAKAHVWDVAHAVFGRGTAAGTVWATHACKTIVSTRAKRSGMRWTPTGLDALLPLRTSILNGAYDSLWEQEYAA